MEYRKVYNRLKARKQREKFSRDEWNTFVSQVQEVLEMAERGELPDKKCGNDLFVLKDSYQVVERSIKKAETDLY